MKAYIPVLSCLLFSIACVYDPPPELLYITNASENTVYLLYTNGEELSYRDSIDVEIIERPRIGAHALPPIYIIQPDSTETLTNLDWKGWMAHKECNCIRFYFVRDNYRKNLTWKEIVDNKDKYVEEIVWKPDDLKLKNKNRLIFR